MSQRDFRVDSQQMERLSVELAALPRDFNGAIVASLRSATLETLKGTVSQFYALSPRKLSGTYRISPRASAVPGGAGVAYEISGRRLSPAHFVISPLQHRAARPMLEIIRGHRYQAGDKIGTDGKNYVPFVMRLKSGKPGAFGYNVFRGVGGKTSTGKPKLHAYRTVSVPQMLGHRQVAQQVQEELLSVFDRVLVPKIAARMDLAAQNILREGG